jgi:hypothetical protein
MLRENFKATLDLTSRGILRPTFDSISKKQNCNFRSSVRSMDDYEGMELPETDLKSILLSSHAKKQRLLRGICETEVSAFIRCGEKTRAGKGRWQYTYGGVVAITDKKSKVVITSWVSPAYGIDLQKVIITDAMHRDHNEATLRLREDKSSLTSHNVIVVDQSGSMRETDATEGVTRSDLVWLTLATVFVADKIKSGERKATDVMSVIDMRDNGEIVIEVQPYDWLLYNKLVDLLRSSQPLNHGNYLPSFEVAKGLLRSNKYSGCALMLIFLSDGRPSDHWTDVISRNKHKVRQNIKKEMGEVASYLGNRLTVGAIAIGRKGSDKFITLRDMVDGAKEYGSRGLFQSASLSADVLATTLNSLTSTVTSTMVQMSEVCGSKQRQFREFQTEPLRNVGKGELTDEFDHVYFSSRLEASTNRSLRTIIRTNFIPRIGWQTVYCDALFHSHEAVGVAFKKRWFGCGAERLLKEFREVDEHGTFVGPLMVAKDTKYVRRGDSKDEKDFHYIFCKTQEKAQRYADSFNRRLNKIEAMLKMSLPRVEFLECCVYMIEHPELGRHGYLVERMLDVRKFEYQKWNLNNGWFKGCKKDAEFEGLSKSLGGENLFAIGEEEESDDDGCSEEGVEDDSVDSTPWKNMNHSIALTTP